MEVSHYPKLEKFGKKLLFMSRPNHWDSRKQLAKPPNEENKIIIVITSLSDIANFLFLFLVFTYPKKYPLKIWSDS